MGIAIRGWIVLAAFLLAGSSNAWGHAMEAHDQADRPWWAMWSVEPLVLVNLSALAALYLVGARRVWGQKGGGRSITRWHFAAFSAAMVSLVAALLSPIDVLATELLWVHMLQHMLLLNVAAPLLVLAAPFLVMLWALPPGGRRFAGRCVKRFDGQRIPRYLLWQPVFLWVLFALVLWVWHLPVLYGAALRNDLVHDLQHLSFLLVSCLFWRVLLDPVARLRMNRGPAVLYLFATSMQAMALGVFMALSPRLWYGQYATSAERWGLTGLEDQQIAGFLMWMPGCMMYAVVAAVVFTYWLQEGKGPVELASGS